MGHAPEGLLLPQLGHVTVLHPIPQSCAAPILTPLETAVNPISGGRTLTHGLWVRRCTSVMQPSYEVPDPSTVLMRKDFPLGSPAYHLYQSVCLSQGLTSDA